MIVLPCIACYFAIRVFDEVEAASSLLGDAGAVAYACPTCAAPVRSIKQEDIDPKLFSLFTIRDLTPNEAFAAVNGLGLPEEKSCSLVGVTDLLKSKKVARVVGTDLQGSERTVIDYVEFTDGTRVYLGASAHGAVVYRIAEGPAYAKRVLDEIERKDNPGV